MAEGTLEAQARVENLDELENVAAEYESFDGEPTLLGFLEEVALSPMPIWSTSPPARSPS